MKENVLKPILLLFFLAFLWNSCGIPLHVREQSTTFPNSKTEVDPGNNTNYLLRNEIIDYAKKQKGVKYKYGGMSRSGFDCSGLSCFVMKKVNKTLPHNSTAQSRKGIKVSVSKARPGDLIFFGKSGKVNHVAIVLENNGRALKVIHSTSSKGVIIEDVNQSTYWKPRIMFARNVL